MLQAIIDIGSNTIRMAIYRIEGGTLTMLFKRKHAVGLASYLKDGVMTKKGIDRTAEVLLEYKEFLAGFGIKNITAFTTAALRNAANSREAVEEIVRRTDLPVRVISGEEEATYDFIGATHDLKEKSGVIIDIGGASTEIVVFNDGKIISKDSLPFGSLSLHEKYCEDILPSGAELNDITAEVAATLKEHDFEIPQAKGAVCGIGGTFKGALALKNAVFQKDEDSNVVTVDELNELIGRFRRDRALTESDTVLLLKTVPDRLITIVTGMTAAAQVLRFFNAPQAMYSDSGVREGYIYNTIIDNKQ